MRGVLRDVAANLVLAAAYFGTAKLGLVLALFGSNVSLIWPASGIAVAVLVLAGLRLVPGVALGSFLANLSLGSPPLTAAVIALGATLAAVAAAWLLARPAADEADRFDAGLARVRDVLRLIFPAALGTPVIAAAIGVAALAQAQLVEPDRVIRAGVAWWAGDALGVLLFAPLVLTWARDLRPRAAVAEALAHAVLIAAVLLAGAIVMASQLPRERTEILAAFVLFPLAVWPAVRFPMREVATFNVVLAMLVVAAAWFGLGPFISGADLVDLVATVGLLASVTLTTLLLCALSTERRAAAGRMRQSEERFRSLTQLSADWYWEQDEQFRFTEVSPAFHAVTGIDPSEQLGKRRWELPLEERDSPMLAAHRRQVEAHQPFRDVLLARRSADGRVRYTLTSGEPIIDGAGKFRGYRGVGRDITAQMEADRAVRESRELFARIFSSSPNPMLINRIGDNRVLEVNDAWCAFFGRERDTIVGRTLEDVDVLVEPGERVRINALLRSRGATRNFELQVRARGGEVRDVLFAAELVDLAGERCVISTLTDVTDRNRALVELRASRERLERMFRGSPLPIAISGIEDGAVIDVNDAWSRTYGYAREAILGRNFLELGLWIDGDARRRMRDQLLASGAVRNFEARWRKASGEPAEVLLSGDVIELDGAPVMLSAALDVTERNSAERRMRESEARFSKIFHSSPVPVVITRLVDGTFIEVNDAWAKWFGWSRDEVVGRTSIELGIWTHPGDREEFVRMLQAGMGVRNMEVRLRKRSGELADVLASADVLELGGEVCALASVMDITDRKAAERQLRESERRFRDFAEAAGEYVLGARRRRALYLRVATRGAGPRLCARRAARPEADGADAARRGRAGARLVRAGHAHAGSVPQPRAPLDEPLGEPGVAARERCADRRRRRPVRRLPRHRARHHRAQAVGVAHRGARHRAIR